MVRNLLDGRVDGLDAREIAGVLGPYAGKLSNGGDTVRLIGINSPESGECFYDEATAVLTALVSPGEQVAMTVDVSWCTVG